MHNVNKAPQFSLEVLQGKQLTSENWKQKRSRTPGFLSATNGPLDPLLFPLLSFLSLPLQGSFFHHVRILQAPKIYSVLQWNDELHKMQTFKLIFNCLMSWLLVEHCCLKNKLGNSIKWLQKIHHIRWRKALTPAWTWRPTSLHLFDKWILENNWNTWLPA